MLSYEQKYLKYKQKYLDLKQVFNERQSKLQVNELENVEQNKLDNVVLSETPVFENNNQHGGESVPATVSSLPNIPSTCPGMVNTNPVPIQVPVTSPLPATGSNVISNKNLTENNNIVPQNNEVMTENNTTEVENIFKQLGGFADDNSSSDFSNSDDKSVSSSDEAPLYSPIASSSVPWSSDN